MAATNYIKNTLLFSLALTVIVVGLILSYSFVLFGKTSFFVFIQNYYSWIYFLIFFIILFFTHYFLLNFAFKLQTKRNIFALYQQLPDLNRQKNTATDLTQLSKQISSLSKDKSQEIDVLNERENYRREFLGNVSHELKTPLFSIQGFLLTLIEGGVNDKNIRDKYLNRINKSVERLIYIVNDLDMISELETAVIKLNIKPFNIVALTQEVFDLLEMKAENNNIKLQFDQFYDTPIKVQADIERIEQVLINLIANVINHASREAKVTVSFKNENGRLKIAITDTGVGIKPEHLSRIFERFYRADYSRNRKQGGSGLGLSIVKHILEAHGEKINVISTYEKETTFSFYLKRA